MQNVDLQHRKTEPVCLGHGLILYKQPKRPGRGSPNWYARVRMPIGNRRVHTKSTGTSDFQLAASRAQDFYGEMLLTKQGGILPQGKQSDRAYRFDLIADAWLDDLQRSAGDDDRRLRRYRDHRKIVMASNGLAAFFGRRDIRMITPKLIADYLDFAERGSTKGVFKPTTKKNHLSTLSLLLGFAVDSNLLDRLPKMPSVKMRDNPRPVFTDWEYHQLLVGCEAIERFYRAVGRFDLADRWQESRDFIEFMVSSFLRPSEWADLRQKHIEIVGGDHPHLKISVVRGKTCKRVAVTMPEAVAAYRRIRKRCGVDPEQFVFMPNYRNRATAVERMGDRFNEVLEQMELACDPFGRKRTIYSLRHTALMLRVLKGDHVDLLALAKNAGTSLRMLERFYCSHLEPQQKIANLQSVRADAPAIPLPKPGVLFYEQTFAA